MPKVRPLILLALCFALPTVIFQVIAKASEHSQLPQGVSNNALRK
ncbi:hypothetical protein [Colwellia sp. MB3u-8]|nr:hypothetical protein [Colwellia sp. MB3u-8]